MTTHVRLLALMLALAAPALALSPTREMRIALVGDSLAYGAGDESGQGIGGRLEGELRGLGFESIVTTNLGVTGTTTRDLVARLERPENRRAIARAHVIVLSVGANDFRAAFLQEEPLPSPLALADQVLRNIEGIVADIRSLNAEARILILGAYAPIRSERAAVLLEPLVTIWDVALVTRFVDDPLVSVVRLSDIIDRPERLSKHDSIHPGGEAYEETAKRIAALLTANR